MPKTYISRSKAINATPAKVYKAVAKLEEWEAWSPWLIMEPEATVTVADDKQSYSWAGKRVGEGHMAITEANKNESCRYDLTFLKPFKSTAKVGMDLKKMKDGTEVTWTMDSQLPFFMFFMKKMMETFVGMDYERGLNLLKDYVEDGEVHSRLNFLGESDYPGGDYFGIKRDSAIADMPEKMGMDFEKVTAWAAENGLNPEDSFSIYHKFNPVKGTCSFTSAVRYKDKPDTFPDGFVTGSQEATRIYTLEHIGPYEHLGNAWSTIQNLIRSKEIKIKKNYHPFEIYGNSPSDTDANNLITHINFAVK